MSGNRLPKRLVCLTSETTEIVFRLGAADRLVGVPGYATRPPEAAAKPKVGGFTTVNVEEVLALEPDLVLSFSDLQKDPVRELIAAGVNVLTSNQRSLQEAWNSILLIGRAIGAESQAAHLVKQIEETFEAIRLRAGRLPRRPRVYFEEWDDPMIAGIGWIGEMIEIAGGREIFPELRAKKSATERVVDGDLVVERDPEIIVAAWCGKRVDTESIRRRAGWERTTASRRNQIHAVEDELFLSPGPALAEGIQALHSLIAKAV